MLSGCSHSTPKSYVYECSGGYSFTTRIEGKKTWLFLPNDTVSLPLVPWGSCVKYREGSILFWSKGDEAVFEIDDKMFENCKNNRKKAIWENAKLRGVDFRAVGNEPGLHLEVIADKKIVYVGNYGNTKYMFDTLEPLANS